MSNVIIGEIHQPEKPKTHDQMMADAKDELLKVFEGANKATSFSPKELYIKLAKYGQEIVRVAIFTLISEDKICFDRHLKIALSESHRPLIEN